MDPFDAQEFWRALGRLYDASVETREAASQLLEITRSHERRLDKAEVTIQAILDAINRRERSEPPAPPQ